MIVKSFRKATTVVTDFCSKNFFSRVDSTNLIKFLTLTFIDKLIIDSIIQKIRLFNALNVETKL